VSLCAETVDIEAAGLEQGQDGEGSNEEQQGGDGGSLDEEHDQDPNNEGDVQDGQQTPRRSTGKLSHGQKFTQCGHPGS
jgi:hypothetical protein